MAKRAILAAAVASAGTFAWSVPAAAQAIDTASLIQRTCLEASRERPEVSRRRLAAFILSDVGILDDDPEARLRRILDRRDLTTAEVRARNVAYRLTEQLDAESPTTPVELGLEARPREDLDRGWRLFRDDVRLLCRYEEEQVEDTSPDAQRGRAARAFVDRFRLRQDAEALTATGEARLKAGSAQLGYERERVQLDDGTTRTDSTLSVEAALGFVVAGGARTSLLVYGAYELDRARSDPPPVLDPGASESDDDTNIFELGFTGHHLISTDPVSIMLRGSGSVVFDRVKESERLRLSLSASPAFGRFPGGPCYFDSFGPVIDLGFARLRGRCTLTLLGQVNHVLDAGTLTLGPADDFVLAGGRFAYEVATGSDSGVIAGAAYEYQQTIHGEVPSIDRFTAYLKYRHWFGERRFGIDFGFDFADGINPDSFVDENRLRFGVGFIF